MSKRNFKNWLAAFVDYASVGEAPLPMYFWTGVSTVAGALRRRVWIDQGHFEWVPNFYIIFVADPGIVSKSTTANIGMNLLREVEGIHFGPQVITWQALVTSLAASTEMLEFPPGTLTFHPMSCITIAADEFGTLLNPNDRELVDILVSLWDGKRGVFDKVTKTSGSDKVENPWLNIIACTTPAWLEGNFPEYMIGGGFTSRCVFVFADKKRQKVAYVSEALKALPQDYNNIKKLLIADLADIASLAGPIKLDPGLIKWGTQWYEKHWEQLPPHLDNLRWRAYLSRKQAMMHKLATILMASTRGDMTLYAEDLQEALAIMEVLEADMPRVFDKIGTSESSRGAAEVVALVKKHTRMSKTELYQNLFRTMSYRDFEDALLSAISAGHVRQIGTASGFFIEAM